RPARGIRADPPVRRDGRAAAAGGVRGGHAARGAMARAAGDGAAPAALRLSRRHARSPRRCHGGAGDRPAPLARAAGRRRRPVRAGGRARIPRGVRHRRRHAAVAPALRASRRAGHDHADRAGGAPQPRRADALPRGCRARRRRPSLSRGRPMTPLTLEANLRAGDHVCAMYDTDAEWLRAAIPYFSEGLVRGEACVYVAPEKDTAQLEVALRAAGIDMDAALRRGALRFATAEATYLRDGHFDPDAIIALWQELIDAAEGNGYTNLRVAGCPTWVNEGVPGAERWAEYEAEVNEFFRGRRAIKLCQYDRRLFSPTLLLDVLGCHPFAVVRGAVHANPFAGMPSARADHDLTDALARERTARLAAEAACRKKDEFIAVFSHELRTPLSSAVLAASLIERLPASDTRVATARDVLRRQESRPLPGAAPGRAARRPRAGHGGRSRPRRPPARRAARLTGEAGLQRGSSTARGGSARATRAAERSRSPRRRSTGGTGRSC